MIQASRMGLFVCKGKKLGRLFLFNDSCIKTETLFEDPKFPKGDIWGGKYDPDIIWKRAKYLSPQTPWFYFEDGASRFHVNQG